MLNTKEQVLTNPQHKSTFEFWGLPLPKEIDNTCHVYFDRNVFFTHGHIVIDRIEADRLFKEQGLKPSTLQGMGAEQALNRERRLVALSNGISSGEIKTVEQAVLVLDGIRTEASVINYLKEIGKKLKLERTGEMVGSDTPIQKSKSPTERFKQVEYKYYDADPLKGGKEITKKEYKKLKAQALKELRQRLEEQQKEMSNA